MAKTKKNSKKAKKPAKTTKTSKKSTTGKKTTVKRAKMATSSRKSAVPKKARPLKRNKKAAPKKPKSLQPEPAQRSTKNKNPTEEPIAIRDPSPTATHEEEMDLGAEESSLNADEPRSESVETGIPNSRTEDPELEPVTSANPEEKNMNPAHSPGHRKLNLKANSQPLNKTKMDRYSQSNNIRTNIAPHRSTKRG
jgi:hypothetical protein